MHVEQLYALASGPVAVTDISTRRSGCRDRWNRRCDGLPCERRIRAMAAMFRIGLAVDFDFEATRASGVVGRFQATVDQSFAGLVGRQTALSIGRARNE